MDIATHGRALATFAVLAVLGSTAIPVASQQPSASVLQGEWVRVDSNNNPNDGMRLRVEGSSALLLFVPSTASRVWQVGQDIWQGVGASGATKVRGSDGAYYSARFELDRTGHLQVRVNHGGAGYTQTWMRAGPSIDGVWVRMEPGSPLDGIQVRATGTEASVTYLPPAAPRPLRVGSRLWQNLRFGGKVEVLDGRRYVPATVTLVGSDTLRMDGDAASVGRGVIWVRPSIVAAAANPTPACVATSLPHDRTGQAWRFGLSSPTNGDSIRETLGIWDYKVADVQPSRRNVMLDLERSRVPGMADGFAYLWEPGTRRPRRWEQYTDMTGAGFANRSVASRVAGLRPSDVEAYASATGTRYAGVFVENTEGIEWWADHDLTNQEYGDAFQARRSSGFRLVDVEAYSTSAGMRYAAIWYKSCDNANWRQWRGMTPSTYQARADSLSALGFYVVDFESYQSPGRGQRIAAIWERIASGRAWAVRTGRRLNTFLNYHRQYVDLGMRLVDYESYQTANGIRYAGIWGENDARHDMPFRVAVDNAIDTYQTNDSIPGISVVVMRNGEVIYRRGFGWADSAKAKQAHSGTIYLTASIAKAFAGTLAARLEEQGRIDLTRLTVSYRPDMSAAHNHTLEQLLSKTGCVTHYPEGPEPVEQYYRSRDSVVVQIGNPSTVLPNCQPDVHYHYSTHGFSFVGAAIEAALNRNMQQIVAEELALPFQLPSLRVAATGGPLAGVEYFHKAQGYRYDTLNAVRRSVDYEDSTWKILGGGLQIDAMDLARFGWLTLNGDVVSDSVRDNRLWMSRTASAVAWDTTTSALNVGLAWNIRQNTVAGQVRNVAEHGGTATGSKSQISIYRDDGLVVAILTNQRNGTANFRSHPLRQLANTVAGAVLANPPIP